MMKRSINKDSYLFSGVLKATAGAVIALLASSAHAGGFWDGMGQWLAETSASLQAADAANSSDSGAPGRMMPLNAAPFDASSIKVSAATATNDPPTASTDADCRDAGGSVGCVQDPANDSTESGLGGTSGR